MCDKICYLGPLPSVPVVCAPQDGRRCAVLTMAIWSLEFWTTAVLTGFREPSRACGRAAPTAADRSFLGGDRRCARRWLDVKARRQPCSRGIEGPPCEPALSGVAVSACRRGPASCRVARRGMARRGGCSLAVRAAGTGPHRWAAGTGPHRCPVALLPSLTTLRRSTPNIPHPLPPGAPSKRARTHTCFKVGPGAPYAIRPPHKALLTQGVVAADPTPGPCPCPESCARRLVPATIVCAIQLGPGGSGPGQPQGRPPPPSATWTRAGQPGPATQARKPLCHRRRHGRGRLAGPRVPCACKRRLDVLCVLCVPCACVRPATA